MDWNYADFPITRRNNQIKKMAGERVVDFFLETPDKHIESVIMGYPTPCAVNYKDILMVLKYQ